MRKGLLAGLALCAVLASGPTMAAGKYSTKLQRLSLTDAAVTSSGALDPLFGKINPFYGNINPFYGVINPFYGDISPFWGNITPFWGDIDPFYGKINPFYGSMDPFWGKITPFDNNPFWATVMPFWRDAGPQWGDINSQWQTLQDSGSSDYSGVQLQLNAFLGSSQSFWSAAVYKYTGMGFNEGFATALLQKYGIDPANAASLANVSGQDRSAFFLDWYDGLMSFTGVDHVDWWMPAINWSPLLTQIQGRKSIVGVLDSSFTRDGSDVASLKFIGGFSYYVNDHGAAVASLIAAKHDGVSVMGVAPDAEIHLYNPFDASGTAGWSDVAMGIAQLYKSGATVVNASLGVSGSTLSPEWSTILTGPLLSSRKHDVVVVKAAGNDGLMQATDVAWSDVAPPGNLIIVGSVGPGGSISSFSNTPGEACITVLGVCSEAGKLKYRFIVAPGELILVSDNHGGVVRMSGTSFAAPLVTGTVALLQERWPWLQNRADETVQIILRSARDLGAPGVDPVYGWGMLDVEAAQSPLDFNSLVVYRPYTYNGKAVTTPTLANWSATSLKSSVLSSGQLTLWENKGAYIVAFENIGATYRDFTIPLSSLLAGKNQKVNGNDNRFQTYLYQRLIDWANGASVAGFAAQSVGVSRDGWDLQMMATDATPDEMRQGHGAFHSEFVASNRENGLALRVGEGSGAHALGGNLGFSLRTDFDPATGGVNPVLGFASGGAYVGGDIRLTDSVNLRAGVSQKSDNHTIIDPLYGPVRTLPLADNRAAASVVGLDYAMSERVLFTASFTHLNEADALLGAQGGGALDFIGGARTDALTLGAGAPLFDGWQLSGSATLSRTSVPSDSQSLLSLTSALKSSAYELAAAKGGLFADDDTMRFSFAQPLHIEGGALRYSSIEVIDRETGALGPVTQRWNVTGNREYRIEALYMLPTLEGRGELAAFGLVDVNAAETLGRGVALSIGARFRMGL